MERWAGKVAVITGASSGIGLAAAKLLLKHGLIVVGLARRKVKMEEEIKNTTNGDKFHALECDVTDEEQVNNAFEWIKTNLKSLHILVNNAGITMFGKSFDIDFKEMKRIIDVNLTGTILCSKLAANIMKESGEESHIIMINSVVGHRISPIPSEFSTNVYAPTKFACKAFVQVLEKELYGQNIRVTNISPGAVKTELLDNLTKEIPRIKDLDTLEPEDVAEAIVYVLGTNPRVSIEELIIKPCKSPY